MSLPACYKTRHSSDLNKISGRLGEAREFIHSCDPHALPAENAKKAYIQRWYGNAGEEKCRELTRHFFHRLVLSAEHFQRLRFFLETSGWKGLPALNHFFMLLDDRYYRWASAVFLPERDDRGLRDIPRARFDRELRKQLPDTVGAGSLARYGQNLLTALRDNGLLSGRRTKTIASVQVSPETLAFMLYTLSDLGVGANDFDGSPLFRSLLKGRDALLLIFHEGERRGFWEVTGDRDRLSFVPAYPSLEAWLKEFKA